MRSSWSIAAIAGLTVFLVLGGARAILSPLLVWILGPALAAAIMIALSVRSMARSFGATQVLLGLPVLLLSVLALWTLAAMVFQRAGAGFFPHLAVAMAIPITVVQAHLARRH